MVKRVLLVGLLAISLIALIGNEASAKVCIVKNADGSCKYWTGSVECGIGAVGIGNVANDCVALGCAVTAINTMWAAACGNPGSNDWTAPGINLVLFDGILTGTYNLQEGDVQKNGSAYIHVTASPDPGLLDAIRDAGACPNLNWSVKDAVPCDMTVRDVQLDANKCVTADATYSCSLPACGTLGWDATAQKFERREYICEKLSTNTYKTPIECPDP